MTSSNEKGRLRTIIIVSCVGSALFLIITIFILALILSSKFRKCLRRKRLNFGHNNDLAPPTAAQTLQSIVGRPVNLLDKSERENIKRTMSVASQGGKAPTHTTT